MMLLRSTLTVVSHKAHRVDRQTGTVHVRGGFFHLTNEIATHFNRVLLCVPTIPTSDASATDAPQLRYADNIELRPLPPFESRRQFAQHLPHVLRTVSGAIRESDIVYAMCPGDPGLTALAIARWHGRPYFVSIDTDRAQKALARRGNWLKRQAAFRFYRHIVHPYLRFMAHDHPTFVTGDMFLGSFPNWHQWVKTTHRSDDLPALHLPTAHSGHFSVAFAGRLAPEKSVETLIDAVASVRQGGTNALLTIIGDGPCRTSLQAHAAQRLPNAHTFLGDVDNRYLLESRFHGADTLVLPSAEERQGKVLVEAMAASVPVIATRAGGIPTVVEDGVNGLLVPTRDVAALAEALQRLSGSIELRQHLVVNGHAYAAANGLDVGVARIARIVETYLQSAR